MLASEQLRIVRVGSELEGFVKDPAAAVGLHLLDVVTDPALAEAMLDCLAKVKPGSSERAAVASKDGAASNTQVVVEKGSDKQVKVSFLTVEG